MLPFSSIEFFIVIGFFILFLLLFKYIFKNNNYKYVLFGLNILFLSFFYPKPIHFLVLILYSYFGVYLFSNILKFTKKIWGILFLLLPMLLVKTEISFTITSLISIAGLSYASFRIMGYYMDKAPGEKMANFITYFNFISFSPTLLIGPIERFHRYKQSEDNGFININNENAYQGWIYFVKGVVFKYIIAELIDRYWLNIFPENKKDLLSITSGMYSYYFYLFFDFAGYSFMAMGVGKLMGIEVPLNFKNPFFAVNPQDFWRKFHISLGDWLKDYFFNPLYMYFTRKKSLKKYPMFRQNTALILTFLLMGCWNGFRFNYIFSGFLFGLYSAIHNTYVIQCKKKGRDVVFGNLNLKIVTVISVFIMFNLVAISLYIFSGKMHF